MVLSWPKDGGARNDCCQLNRAHFKHGEDAKALSPLRWYCQELSKAPALSHCQLALALEKEGLSHGARQNKWSLKSQPSYPNAGLPSAPTLIHLSYLPRAGAGHSPSSADEDQSWRQAEAG